MNATITDLLNKVNDISLASLKYGRGYVRTAGSLEEHFARELGWEVIEPYQYNVATFKAPEFLVLND